MNNPEDYRAHNRLQHRDNLACLKEYGQEIVKANGSFIDIGCGDGSVTSKIVEKYLPSNYKALVGTDKCQEMIDYAEKHYASDRISFMVLDITDTIPDDFLGRFDQAFSFYTLHWVQNQEQAFLNIYHLLNMGGSFFTTFLGNVPLFFDVCRILSLTNRWSGWLLDAETYISPYHDCLNPELYLKNILTKIGFADVRVICKDMTFIYDGIEDFKKAIKAVNPFKIPEENFEDYMNDFIQIAYDKGVLDNDYCMKYKLIIVSGNKK